MFPAGISHYSFVCPGLLHDFSRTLLAGWSTPTLGMTMYDDVSNDLIKGKCIAFLGVPPLSSSYHHHYHQSCQLLTNDTTMATTTIDPTAGPESLLVSSSVCLRHPYFSFLRGSENDILFRCGCADIHPLACNILSSKAAYSLYPSATAAGTPCISAYDQLPYSTWARSSARQLSQWSRAAVPNDE